MASHIEVVDYDPSLATAFRELNVEWLERYFKVEVVDEAVFADPEGKLLAGGGAILFARLHDADSTRIVGTCALKHEGNGTYELTKMAVSPAVQRAGIGAILMQAVLDRFQTLGGAHLYLETNKVLQPAIALYRRFGFIDTGQRKPGSVYARSDVHMVWHGGS